MKKIFLGLLVAAITFSAASAQPTGRKSEEMRQFHKGERKMKYSEQLEKLNLTEEQKTRIKSINELYAARFRALNKEAGTPEEKKSKRVSLIQEHRAKLKEVLTPEQRIQAGELFRAKKETSRNDRNHKERKGKGFEELSKTLELNADQQARISALNTAFKADIKNIKDNDNLSEENKEAQIKELRQKHRADIEALLTREQKQEWKDHHKSRKEKNVK